MTGRILIAGGTGLIGNALVEALLSKKQPIVASYFQHAPPKQRRDHYIKCDFTNFDDCMKALEGIDTCIICAGTTLGSEFRKQFPTANLLPLSSIYTGLLEACARNGVKKVILISSTTLYQPSDTALKESELNLNEPPHSSYLGVGNLYRYIEQLAYYYHQCYGINFSILRVTNAFGEYDKFDGSGTVIPSLIKRIIEAKDSIEIYGNEEVTRDFYYVKDLAADLISILDLNDNFEIYNMGNGTPVTIKTLVDTLMTLTKNPIKHKYSQSDNTIQFRTVSIEKLKSKIGNTYRTPLKKSLRNTIIWHKKSNINTDADTFL